MNPMKIISVRVSQGNVLEFPTDVLVLKYAQSFHGADAAAAELFEEAGQPLQLPMPMRGTRLVRSVRGIAARQVLFVGVPPLQKLDYGEIRDFARKALTALSEDAPQCRHIALTIHGPGYGLDETEAFTSEVAGLVDAVQAAEFPESLADITFVERNHGRARRLAQVLEDLLPEGQLRIGRHGPERTDASRERLSQAAEAKKHVFVAMPFKEEMEDVYYYGIQSAVQAAGYLCERADLSAFTGDVLDWVRSRIQSASFVVADLTEANPNVYLEVGYSWGIGVPTVLIVRDTADLKFDVRGQRCLVYKKIRDLEEKLNAELKGLTSASGVA